MIRVSKPFNLIHSYICEFEETLTSNEKRYFIIFIDDCSNFSYVYLLKNESEVIDMFKIFLKEVENQFNLKIN